VTLPNLGRQEVHHRKWICVPSSTNMGIWDVPLIFTENKDVFSFRYGIE
jgi:hypothetical protein